jgi:hypothetical protein
VAFQTKDRKGHGARRKAISSKLKAQSKGLGYGVFEGPMIEKREKRSSVMINRAPVLTLWAAVVAEMMGLSESNVESCGKTKW